MTVSKQLHKKPVPRPGVLDELVNRVPYRVIQDRHVTAVAVEVRVGFQHFSATGSAKRNQGEEFNAETGRRLALARALRSLANELERGIE